MSALGRKQGSVPRMECRNFPYKCRFASGQYMREIQEADERRKDEST